MEILSGYCVERKQLGYALKILPLPYHFTTIDYYIRDHPICEQLVIFVIQRYLFPSQNSFLS